MQDLMPAGMANWKLLTGLEACFAGHVAVEGRKSLSPAVGFFSLRNCNAINHKALFSDLFMRPTGC